MDANRKTTKKTTKNPSGTNKQEELKEPSNPTKISKEVKTAKLIYDSQLTVKITYKKSEQESLTCGWLLQEALQSLNDLCKEKNLERDFKTLIAFKTKQKNVQLDYWLSLPKKSLCQLPDNAVLLPVHSVQPATQSRNGQVTQNDFEMLSILGEGCSCDVFAARKKDTGKIYAIKRIGKKVLSSFDKTSTVVRRELAALKKLNSNFIVKLHYTYQTNNYYYFVLDYLPGGDLFYYLNKDKKFVESVAKFYIAELLVGLKEIHLQNIIYRDLKPENVLIDIDGHACLADFGLGKEVDDLKSLQNSYVGTVEYMAPELAAKKPYTYAVDFYSLGVVAYEMLVGKAPFVCKSSDSEEFAEMIQKKEPSIPTRFSEELQDFLSRLLHKDPSKRLGSENGAEEIMKHSWFEDIDFSKLANKELLPPFKVNMSQLNLLLEELDLGKECAHDDENPKAGRGVRQLSRFSFSEDVDREPMPQEFTLTKVEEITLTKAEEITPVKVKEIKDNVPETQSIDSKTTCPATVNQTNEEAPKPKRKPLNVKVKAFVAKEGDGASKESFMSNQAQLTTQFLETLQKRGRQGSCEIPFNTEIQDPLMLKTAPLM